MRYGRVWSESSSESGEWSRDRRSSGEGMGMIAGAANDVVGVEEGRKKARSTADASAEKGRVIVLVGGVSVGVLIVIANVAVSLAGGSGLGFGGKGSMSKNSNLSELDVSTSSGIPKAFSARCLASSFASLDALHHAYRPSKSSTSPHSIP